MLLPAFFPALKRSLYVLFYHAFKLFLVGMFKGLMSRDFCWISVLDITAVLLTSENIFDNSKQLGIKESRVRGRKSKGRD